MSSFSCGCDREVNWTCERHTQDIFNRPWKLRVIIESPLSASSRTLIEENKRYARLCMRDSLLRGEAPFASHVLYDHADILDDLIPNERKQGMHAGFEWIQMAELSAIYDDLGISSGMKLGIVEAQRVNRRIEYRKLPAEVFATLDKQ